MSQRICDYCYCALAKFSHKIFYYCVDCELERIEDNQVDSLPFADDLPIDLVVSHRWSDIIEAARIDSENNRNFKHGDYSRI